jgi:hypothetical protein
VWKHPPPSLESDDFVLEPLGPEHNEADYAAWSTSLDHIRATPGFRADHWGGDDWPYPMSLDQNRADLVEHAEEFARGEAFAYTVLDPSTRDVIGCVYVDPDDVAEVRCRLWIRTDHAHLDGELEHVVRTWLAGPDWLFTSVCFPGRD